MARQTQRPARREHGRPAAASRRKEAIDRGLAADKVPGFDPAAAPLGTDDEAAGAPPAAVADPLLSREARADPAGLAADPGGTERGGYRMQDRMAWPVIIASVLIALAIVVALILFA